MTCFACWGTWIRRPVATQLARRGRIAPSICKRSERGFCASRVLWYAAGSAFTVHLPFAKGCNHDDGHKPELRGTTVGSPEGAVQRSPAPGRTGSSGGPAGTAQPAAGSALAGSQLGGRGGLRCDCAFSKRVRPAPRCPAGLPPRHCFWRTSNLTAPRCCRCSQVGRGVCGHWVLRARRVGGGVPSGAAAVSDERWRHSLLCCTVRT